MNKNILLIPLLLTIALKGYTQISIFPEININSPDVIECPPESDISQAPVDNVLAITSNYDIGLVCAAQINGWTYGSLGSVRFFGIQSYFDLVWTVCSGDPLNFNIVFYEDNGGFPGTVLSSYNENISHIETGDIYSPNYPIYYYDWMPESAIEGLPVTFWVSFQNTETDCWFNWLDTPTGNGLGAQDNGSWTITNYPLGYCLKAYAADIEELSDEQIVIYPNPSKGIININVEKEFNLEILDITGKNINTKIISRNTAIEMNTAGIYFLRFSNSEGSVTHRVIVQ